MNIVQLAPKPGQAPNIGTGQVFFSSPNAPSVAQGDPWTLLLIGQVPNRGEIGHMMPWETALTYDGGTDANGNMTIEGTCQVSGTHQLTDGSGLVIAVGVVPGNAVNPLGFEACQYAPALPAPPAPTPGLPTLAAAVLASWLSKIPVADWPSQSVSVSYVAQQPGIGSPYPVTIWAAECLNNQASQNIASLLGGTVVQIPPPPQFCMFAIGAVPLVNGIQATINGVLMQANAGEVAQAFWQPAGTTLAQMENAILAKFSPVA